MKRTVIGAKEAFRIVIDEKRSEGVRNAVDAYFRRLLRSGEACEAKPQDKGGTL